MHPCPKVCHLCPTNSPHCSYLHYKNYYGLYKLNCLWLFVWPLLGVRRWANLREVEIKCLVQISIPTQSLETQLEWYTVYFTSQHSVPLVEFIRTNASCRNWTRLLWREQYLKYNTWFQKQIVFLVYSYRLSNSIKYRLQSYSGHSAFDFHVSCCQVQTGKQTFGYVFAVWGHYTSQVTCIFK